MTGNSLHQPNLHLSGIKFIEKYHKILDDFNIGESINVSKNKEIMEIS